jgi:hypothetical protein
MPGLIRAGAVDPPVKQAKSGRAGLGARLRGAVASVAQKSRVRTADRRELFKTCAHGPSAHPSLMKI